MPEHRRREFVKDSRKGPSVTQHKSPPSRRRRTASESAEHIAAATEPGDWLRRDKLPPRGGARGANPVATGRSSASRPREVESSAGEPLTFRRESSARPIARPPFPVSSHRLFEPPRGRLRGAILRIPSGEPANRTWQPSGLPDAFSASWKLRRMTETDAIPRPRRRARSPPEPGEPGQHQCRQREAPQQRVFPSQTIA